MKFLKALIFTACIPLVTHAQTLGLEELLININREILNPLITATFAVAAAYFIYGVVRFIWENQQGKTSNGDGQRHMMYGLIGMFIMGSVFGIIQFITNTVQYAGDLTIQNGQVQMTTDGSLGAGANAGTNQDPTRFTPSPGVINNIVTPNTTNTNPNPGATPTTPPVTPVNPNPGGSPSDIDLSS